MSLAVRFSPIAHLAADVFKCYEIALVGVHIRVATAAAIAGIPGHRLSLIRGLHRHDGKRGIIAVMRLL